MAPTTTATAPAIIPMRTEALGSRNPSPLFLFVVEPVGVCSKLLEEDCVAENEVPGELEVVPALEEEVDERENA